MRRAWLPLLLAAVVAACHASPAPATAPAPTRAAPGPLHRGPLLDYVPAAGLRWLVVGRPRELADTPGLVAALAPLLPPDRLDAFASVTGVDLRKTPSAVVAGFDYGTLYLAEPTGDSFLVEELFIRRLARGAIVKTPHPRLRRILGVVGQTPESLVSIRGEVVALAVGDITEARIVEAYARGKLQRSPTALRGAALSTLPATLEAAPLRFYAPGPFEGEWAGAAHGLLGAATAVGAAVVCHPPGRIELELVIAGDFSRTPADGAARLADAWVDLATSETGKLLGLDRAAAAPVVAAAADQLRLRVELGLEPVVAGLHAAVSADIWEVMGLPEPAREPLGNQMPPATNEK